MEINYSYGTHDVNCSVRDAKDIMVINNSFRGLHPGTVAYAVKRFMIKDGRMSSGIARECYALRLRTGKGRKPRRHKLSGPASRFGLPGERVRAEYTVTPEGAVLDRAELT